MSPPTLPGMEGRTTMHTVSLLASRLPRATLMSISWRITHRSLNLLTMLEYWVHSFLRRAFSAVGRPFYILFCIYCSASVCL